jgi:predicted alpha-1,6-mannanase (GH76 family)
MNKLTIQRITLALALIGLPVMICGQEAPGDGLTKDAITQRITSGFDLLNKLYWSPALSIWLDRPGDDLRAHYEGRRNPPWWSSANAVEVMIDFMNVTGRTDYDASISALYEIHRDHRNKVAPMVAELKRRGQWNTKDEDRLQQRLRKEAVAKHATDEHYVQFRNEYLDDSGWWGITWLKMYHRAKDPRYLETAKAIHVHMAKNWRPDKGGGVLWCEDADKQKANAITNSLFLILSARLHSTTQDATYLDWAEKTLTWFRDQKLYDGTAIVDAPGHTGDYWTYNQGTYLGGLIAMSEATGKSEYLDEAARVAETILTNSGVVLPSGVIVEKLGTSGWDVGMFKGVFIRYLSQLRDILHDRRAHRELAQRIDSVIRKSSASLLTHGLGDTGEYTVEWEEGGKDRSTSFNTQTSALAALTATLTH